MWHLNCVEVVVDVVVVNVAVVNVAVVGIGVVVVGAGVAFGVVVVGAGIGLGPVGVGAGVASVSSGSELQPCIQTTKKPRAQHMATDLCSICACE